MPTTQKSVAQLLNLAFDDANDHIEISLKSPRLPFGSIHTEVLTPMFQSDAVYGIVTEEIVTTTGLAVGTGSNSGAVTGTNNLFTCATGTTSLSFATLQSRRRLRYRPGQGVVTRFTALFSTPAANSILVAGVGTGESGVYFGYNGTSFGILHSTGGVREIHTLTVTTASTATNSYVVTLPNGGTVSVTATNNNSLTRTAYEISQGTFPGWTAQAVGATVIFLAGSAGPLTGTFSLAQTGAGTPAAGTDVETLAGVAGTDTWIPQTTWNGDKMDGTGKSGVTLDPSKGNVFQIGIQYLGFGAISFQVEVTYNDGNDAQFITVHTIKFPNTRTGVTFSQPAFPFTMAAYSAGSSTNVSVSSSSFAGFIEGQRINLGPRETYYNLNPITSSTSAYIPLFTFRNSLTYATRANQSVLYLIGISGSTKSNTGQTLFFLIRNATLSAGNPNFAAWSGSSCTIVDTAATVCTFSDNDQVIWTGSLSESDSFDLAFTDKELTVQPGESITLAVRSVSATAVCLGSLNTREDH